MQIFYCDIFDFPLPAAHRFPLRKFRLLREKVLVSGLVPPNSVSLPSPVTRADLLLAHDPAYVDRMLEGRLAAAEERRLGFPWSPQLVLRALHSAGGTLAAARAALADGVGLNLAGGTHHAGKAHGEGYCLFNDSIIAIRHLQRQGLVRRAIVIDCDVHQGNGTAEIAANDDSIFTFSIHAQKNFPARKFPSNLDVDLPDGTDDAAYLAELQWHLPEALDRAAADFAVFLAGADPFRGDRLGRLALSETGLRQRDRFVMAELHRRQMPVAVCMAGGYADPIEQTVAIQFNTVAEAIKWCREESSPSV